MIRRARDHQKPFELSGDLSEAQDKEGLGPGPDDNIDLSSFSTLN